MSEITFSLVKMSEAEAIHVCYYPLNIQAFKNICYLAYDILLHFVISTKYKCLLIQMSCRPYI